MSALQLSDSQLLHIFVEVAQGRGRHGGFLKSLAEAISRADAMNFRIMRPVSMIMIEKYDLAKYLDNFEGSVA